jgi:hypothetical protein
MIYFLYTNEYLLKQAQEKEHFRVTSTGTPAEDREEEEAKEKKKKGKKERTTTK